MYLRVSDGFDWIRARVCEHSEDAPAYFDCPNSVDPVIAPVPSPVAPPSPVLFRYDVFNDWFLFEAGIVIEKITGLNTVELVEYVTPGSLLSQSLSRPETDLSTEVQLEANALYSFSIMDGEADGLYLLQGDSSMCAPFLSLCHRQDVKDFLLSL